MKRTFLIVPKPNSDLKKELHYILHCSDYHPRVRLRVAIILRSSQGISDVTVAQEFNSSKEMVKTWVERFLLKEDELNEIAEKGEPEETRKAIVEILSDKRRRGAPKKFTKEVTQDIKKIAQNKPSQYGFSSETWTFTMIGQAAVDEGIVPSISTSSVSRIFEEPSDFFFPVERVQDIVDDNFHKSTEEDKDSPENKEELEEFDEDSPEIQEELKKED